MSAAWRNLNIAVRSAGEVVPIDHPGRAARPPRRSHLLLYKKSSPATGDLPSWGVSGRRAKGAGPSVRIVCRVGATHRRTPRPGGLRRASHDSTHPMGAARATVSGRRGHEVPAQPDEGTGEV